MTIRSKTTSGIDVDLTGEEYLDHPMVRVEFTHPKVGKVAFRSDSFATVDGQRGIVGYFGSQRVCVTVPKADFDATMDEARAIASREIEAIKSGDTPIELSYHDGEYLSGHIVYGRAGELLVELGLAEHVSGWGCHVSPKAVESLGERFTYAAAAEFARPAMERKAEKCAKKEAARSAKFELAKQTGRPVELERWTEDCCERNFDCDLDVVVSYAQPDGSTKTKRTHTH